MVLAVRPVSTTVDWYSFDPLTTLNSGAVMLLGVPAAGYESGRLAGTVATWAVQSPSGPQSRVPGVEDVVAQFTSAPVWVRSVM